MPTKTIAVTAAQPKRSRALSAASQGLRIKIISTISDNLPLFKTVEESHGGWDCGICFGVINPRRPGRVQHKLMFF
jgi:hypothetical protein